MSFPNKETQFQPGQSGNPAGKPKGRRNLMTLIQDMMEDDIEWDTLEGQETIEKFRAKYQERKSWEAVIHVAFIKSLQGDTRAMTWLANFGYGTKTTVESEQGLFSSERLQVEIVKPKLTSERDAESSDATAERSADN